MATVAEIFKTMEYGPAPESDKEALGWLGKHERVGFQRAAVRILDNSELAAVRLLWEQCPT